MEKLKIQQELNYWVYWVKLVFALKNVMSDRATCERWKCFTFVSALSNVEIFEYSEEAVGFTPVDKRVTRLLSCQLRVNSTRRGVRISH